MWNKIRDEFKLPIIAFIPSFVFFYFCTDYFNWAYVIGLWIALWVYSIITLLALGINILDKPKPTK